MKILITTDLFTVSANGVVTSVKNLYEALKNRGHDVRILTLSDNIKSKRNGDFYFIRSIPIGIYPGVRMPTSYRHGLIQEIVDWKPDVIHSQCEFFSMQYANRISKLTNAPIVHTYHTMYEQYVRYVVPGKKMGQLVVSYLTSKRLKRAKLVIVPTNKMKVLLVGDYKLKQNVAVIPSGINLEQHKKRISTAERSEKRKQYGIEDDKFVLVNLGRLGMEKNISELLKYFAKVVTVNSETLFLIVGDGPAKKELQRQAVELGIQNHVIFTGMVSPAEVSEYYQMGDLFVSASTSETQGLTYVEAAANGLPLLCRKDPCLDGVIIDGENGYQYSSEQDFAKYISDILSNAEWKVTASKRSEEISSAYDKETFGSTVESIYETIIEKV